ncbi:ACT domain-containing protein [Kordiimonas aquimaris]|uniref:ACT domain-containing protein n=1 Tax=Kordiimonas aquimaris TaxID=707591 RepID=UPI0021D0B0F5|nr:ACT domain-containing protein [Kordiimonas aquimaris]
MSGSKNLSHLLGSMQPELHDEVFVFATMSERNIPDSVTPIMQFSEAEGTTIIAPLRQLEEAGLDYEFPCRMVTLNIHSALDAVGFLALVSTRLATLNIGVNPVSGFYHDHLFIPADAAEDVLAELVALSAEHRSMI